MEICHFFVIFYDFVMKCVYKSTIYTFVIRDKIWTHPLCCTKVYMLLLCFGPENTPHPIHVRHFCVSPPPPPDGGLWVVRERQVVGGLPTGKKYFSTSDLPVVFCQDYYLSLHLEGTYFNLSSLSNSYNKIMF